MENRVKKEYSLEGLCCTSCADKIERESKQILGVDEAVVDFVNKRLIMYSQTAHIEQIEVQAKQIVNRIEPDVIFSPLDKSKPQSIHTVVKHSKMLRFVMSAVLFAMAMVLDFSPGIQIGLFVIAYGLAGFEVLKSAFNNISHGRIFDENFLMSIATFGAFAIGEYPEAVGVMLFYQVGEIFQDMAVNRSRRSIGELMNIRPDFAHLVINDQITKVSPESVTVGQTILVKPGERIPLDGIIVEGSTFLDTSALTGESVPRKFEVGQGILGGSINLQAVIKINVTHSYGESTVAKILDLVQNASEKKAPTESFITRFARYYTPFVVFSALALATIPPFLLGLDTFSVWFYRALVFLVVSCPCALVISVPLGYFGGIGGASRSGILIKGGNYLDALNKVKTVVFDKTGTLTQGVFQVTEVLPVQGVSEIELLEMASLAEVHSSHPIATAIIKAYGQPMTLSNNSTYEEFSGLGIKAVVGGDQILIGNQRMMAESHIHVPNGDYKGTVVFVAKNDHYKGCILIADQIKEGAVKALHDLRALGVERLILLTGDREDEAMRIASVLGIDEVHSELLPQNKVEVFETIEEQFGQKGKIVFVGDGINDAPVLARADIGIAMGGIGSDAAIEAADIVLMTDDLSRISQAIKIGRKTHQIVMQNIIFALGVKALIMILGALGIATMWEAVFGDVGVALIAVLNSSRALKIVK